MGRSMVRAGGCGTGEAFFADVLRVGKVSWSSDTPGKSTWNPNFTRHVGVVGMNVGRARRRHPYGATSTNVLRVEKVGLGFGPFRHITL